MQISTFLQIQILYSRVFKTNVVLILDKLLNKIKHRRTNSCFTSRAVKLHILSRYVPRAHNEYFSSFSFSSSMQCANILYKELRNVRVVRMPT